MKRFILIAATAALAIGNTALASGTLVVRPARPHAYAHRPATGVLRTAVVTKSYHLSRATRFAGGYYYAGRHHNHWSRTVYSRVYNRTVYLDPGLRLWYFWDAARGRYYPVSSLK
jgi:hypothetical protein